MWRTQQSVPLEFIMLISVEYIVLKVAKFEKGEVSVLRHFTSELEAIAFAQETRWTDATNAFDYIVKPLPPMGGPQSQLEPKKDGEL